MPIDITSNPTQPEVARKLPKMDEAYFQNQFNTPLDAKEQLQYNSWLQQESAKRGRDMSKDSVDYDMQGWWKNMRNQSSNDARGHFPDTYKKPNHPTFSNQSQYNGAPAPWGGVYEGGQWAEDGSTYTPSKSMLQYTHPASWLQNYMKQREPNTKLVMPK